MQNVFLELVKLSLIGSLFASAVMLVRLVFRKAPKWLFCVLWGVVALRLICPISIESNFSLVPDRIASGQIITNVGDGYIGEVDIIYEGNAGYSNAVEAGRQPIYSNDGYYVVTEKDSLEAPKTVGETVYPILSWIWLAGIALMFAYTAVSYLVLRKKMAEATHLRDNIWQCEQVDSPFVLGIIKPRIYLSYAITESDMTNVIAHEQAHIHRKDHWWKPIGFLLLSVHWFNPVLWVAYVLLCRDIEAACDEKVIKHMETDEMRAYSTALLNYSVHRRRIAACPLAFGEVGVKERIKRVMNYKKPTFWIIIAAIIVSILVSVLLLTNPTTENSLIREIVNQKVYTIVEQQTETITLSLPVSILPDKIFSAEGVEFSQGEIIAYQDETATIYLKSAQLSNEGTDQLYFCFDFIFDLPKDGGKTIYPFKVEKNGLTDVVRVTDGSIRTDNHVFDAAVSDRGQGSFEKIWFYLSVDAIKKAEGRVEFDIQLNTLSYLKDGLKYEDVFNQTDIEERLLQLIDEIMNNPDCAASSNPFTYIEAKKSRYNEILTYGSKAVDFLVEQLRTGENGLQGYIMAVACADITGIGDKDLGADWGTAQEWLALFDKSEKNTIIPPVIATDYISGKQARLLSFGYTSDKPGQSEIACGIAPLQGDYGEGNTLVLDGKNGQNQILLTPKGFSFSQYGIYLPDGTVYDDGTRAAYDSLGLRVMCSDKGICLIAPFQTGEYIYEIVLSWPEQGLTVTYGLKVVMTGEESDYDRAIDSVFDAYGEGNPLIAVSLVDRYTLANSVYSSSRYLFKVENIPNAPIWVEVSQGSGEIIAEVDDPEKWLIDPPYVDGQTHVSGGNTDGRQMTLADVIELSKLGMDLTWEDLKEFIGTDIGSGLHVVTFKIDPEFYLLVGDGKTTGEPMYAYLNAISNGASCDIREHDVESFIKENQSDALDYAIHKAVIEHNADGTFPDFPNGFIPTQIHYIFGIETKSGTPVVGQLNHMEETTVYVQYVYNRYLYSNGELTKVAGNATPAKITFSVVPEMGYVLKDFWEPNGGSVYAEEIRDYFPEDIADIVLNPQSDVVDTEKMEHACLIKAQEYVHRLLGLSSQAQHFD